MYLFCFAGKGWFCIVYCFSVMDRSEVKTSLQVHPVGDRREQRVHSHSPFKTVEQGVKRFNINKDSDFFSFSSVKQPVRIEK